MPEEAIKDYAKAKGKEVITLVCTVVADLMLAGIWLIGEYSFETYLVPKFRVDSLVAAASLWLFRVIFAMSTLIPCLSKVLMHIKIIWLRDRAAVKKTKEELESQTFASSAAENKR